MVLQFSFRAVIALPAVVASCFCINCATFLCVVLCMTLPNVFVLLWQHALSLWGSYRCCFFFIFYVEPSLLKTQLSHGDSDFNWLCIVLFGIKQRLVHSKEQWYNERHSQVLRWLLTIKKTAVTLWKFRFYWKRQ